MLTNPAQWILHNSQNHLSQCHHKAQPSLCISETSVPTPHSCISAAKWTVPCSFCASWMTSVLLFTLVICHAGKFPSFFPILWPPRLGHLDFHRLRHGDTLVHEIVMTQWINWTPFLQCDLHDLWVQFFPKRFPVNWWASTTHAYFALRLSDSPQLSLRWWLWTLHAVAVVSFRVQTSRFIRVRNSNFVRVDQHNVARCNCAWSDTKRHIVKEIDINCFQSHKLKTWHASVNVHNLRPAVAFDVQSVRTNISKMQTEIATFGRPGGKHIRAPATNSCNSSRTTNKPKTITMQDSAAQESKHANPLMNMPFRPPSRTAPYWEFEQRMFPSLSLTVERLGASAPFSAEPHQRTTSFRGCEKWAHLRPSNMMHTHPRLLNMHHPDRRDSHGIYRVQSCRPSSWCHHGNQWLNQPNCPLTRLQTLSVHLKCWLISKETRVRTTSLRYRNVGDVLQNPSSVFQRNFQCVLRPGTWTSSPRLKLAWHRGAPRTTLDRSCPRPRCFLTWAQNPSWECSGFLVFTACS